MSELQLRNDLCWISVSHDGTVSVAGSPEQDRRTVRARSGYMALPGMPGIGGLRFYEGPCPYQLIHVRQEGSPTLLAEKTAGLWPTEVDDEVLETYPTIHLLEERKTAAPWRLDCWYTLAGPYLVYESEQYFERARPRQGGRDWERFVISWRQVLDLQGVLDGAYPTTMLLGSGDDSATEER